MTDRAGEAHEKYRELYELSVRLLNEEQERFARLDQKAATYLSALTFALAVYGYAVSSLFAQFPHGRGAFGIALVALASILCLLLLSSWYLSFSVLKIQGTEKMPLDIDFYDRNTLLNAHYALARGNKEALECNQKIGDQKSKSLAVAYVFMCITMAVVVAFLIGLVLYRFFDC